MTKKIFTENIRYLEKMRATSLSIKQFKYIRISQNVPLCGIKY